MRLSDLSIKNPVFAWMLMAALIIFGAIGFSRMGLSQMPDVDFPVLTVSVNLEGAAPEIIETTVVDPLEDALMTIEGVISISSSSKTGSATVTVEFDLDRNIDVALQEVQAKVAQAQRRLPKEIEPPIISKTNPDDQPIIWLALSYDKDDPVFLMKYARDYLKDRFTTVAGVGDLIIGGYTDPMLRVWVKPQELIRQNLTVNDIIESIQNGHVELPGGFVTDKIQNKNLNVRTMGEAKSLDDFKQIVISKRAGQQISDPSMALRLSQVARVEEGLGEVTKLSRFNGQSALGLGLRKQRGSNAVAVARAVRERMNEIQSTLPPGMKLQVNFDTTRFIEDSVRELNKHLILAVILTSLVCWMFLGSWSATFNVLMSIPTSIMGAFIGLYFLGFTLNTFTLLGLTLAIGIVVDDAIMVLENIFRHNEKGKGSIESAIIGAREITFAALAASVAVIAIFLPVAFMKGVIGKYFLQFGVTISLAVFLSLIESLTITPMRCASFVSHGKRTSKLGKAFEDFMEFLEKSYKKVLTQSLQHRWKVMALAVAITVASFILVKFIKSEFVPSQDQSLFITRLSLPVDSSLDYTNQQLRQAEKWFLSRPEVKQVYAAIGGMGASGNDVNVATLFVTLKNKGQRGIDPTTKKELSQSEFMDIARKEMKKIKDVRPVLMDLSQRGFSSGRGYPIEFLVLGSEWDKLAESSQKIQKMMEESGFLVDVDSNYLLGLPEIQLVPDRITAGSYGLSMGEIGKTVNALIGGVKVGDYPQGGHRYDIRLQMEKSDNPVEQIKNLTIANPRGNLIPLSRVVKQEINPSLQSISRNDRQRAISITANLKGGMAQDKAMNYIFDKSKPLLPPGFLIKQTGSAKTFKESFQSLIFALILGFIVAYMVLASQFNSFLDPVSILMALPFSFTGAFLALLVTGQSLNIFSMIGLLLLMGIVKKNSILLVEFTNSYRQNQKLSCNQSLIEACPVRLRPILMTSIATIAGALPSAMATGSGSETMRPMAIALIGGVLLSTVLTLFVVPCFYSLMDRFKKSDKHQELTLKAFENIEFEAEQKHFNRRSSELIH